MNWDIFTDEMKKLGEKIDYQPDCIVGIARGGVIPAVLLSQQLLVMDMYVLKVRVEGNERKVLAEVFTNISNKKILLVEDMLETGKSMSTAKNYLESKGAEVRTACLYIMPHTECKPKYYLKEVPKVAHFPWE
ncbi:hypothetical protein A3I42_02925 [Candidatus Uhrbacteria bacterium RIFCSPLOWO2_02_FULL_49_11]|uniref:Phosphoribosyltransferase domain-containing protein n=1 Tax=Candidatus Uhrbacteria bacterium RIFCSPLOWO2_02_FULL_49_11 TaxID=1802409 RepID=A0A1F7VF22_9BACT|nr:MAG: hypothetical protein A3I42_02925 [Candidatus Uhrbacteria bacterium RIFCSPLOWO2_02_FULL_49_11]